MRVILLKDQRHLGRRGDEVEVKDGFGRNYLVPQGIALISSEGNRKYFEQQREKIEAVHVRERDEALGLAAKLADLRIEVTKKAGEGGTLYGSVTATDVAEELAAKGAQVDRRRIDLEGGIKSIGDHEVRIHLHSEVVAAITVTVLPEE
jgi:large subunit ribosomal protein L9